MYFTCLGDSDWHGLSGVPYRPDVGLGLGLIGDVCLGQGYREEVTQCHTPSSLTLKSPLGQNKNTNIVNLCQGHHSH